MNIFYFTDIFPKLSEIFISREIAGMEKMGNTLSIFSNLDPQDTVYHGINNHLKASVYYSSHFQPGKMVKGANLLKYLVSKPGRFSNAFQCSKVQGLPEMNILFRQLPLICNLVKRTEAVHIHCHFGRVGMLTGWLASRMLGLPFSVTLHGVDIQHTPYKNLGVVLKDANMVVCVSEKIRDLVQTSYDIPYENTALIRCGIPVAEYTFPEKLSSGLRILTVARLDAVKGLSNLIEGCALLRDRNLPFECTIVGEGPEREELQRQIEAFDLSSFVRLNGALPNEQLPDVYAEHSVFVLPSYSEGVPVVVMEAMASGLPVVASRVGGIPEIVEDGENGFLVEPGKPEQIADAVGSVFRLQQEKCMQIRNNNREKIEKYFNTAHEVAKLNALFEKLQQGHQS